MVHYFAQVTPGMRIISVIAFPKYQSGEIVTFGRPLDMALCVSDHRSRRISLRINHFQSRLLDNLPPVAEIIHQTNIFRQSHHIIEMDNTIAIIPRSLAAAMERHPQLFNVSALIMAQMTLEAVGLVKDTARLIALYMARVMAWDFDKYTKSGCKENKSPV